MRALMVEPGMAPYEKEINGLKEMQTAVGGRISAIYPFQEPVALVSNEESIFLKMPFNRSVEGGYSHQRRLESRNGGNSGGFLQEQRQSQSRLAETAPTPNPRNRPHCGRM